jgi:hypothetical protein
MTKDSPFLSCDGEKRDLLFRFFPNLYKISFKRFETLSSQLFNVVLNHEMRFADVGEDLEPQAQRHQIPWLEITKGSSISGGAAILTTS